jgi:hypothetical protein
LHFTRACLARTGGARWGDLCRAPQLLDEFRRRDFRFSEADIADLTHLAEVDLVVNFAAETHVDNSILTRSFLRSNTGRAEPPELIRGKRNYELPVLCRSAPTRSTATSMGLPGCTPRTRRCGR